MKKIKTYSNFVNEDTDISYYEVEYYDIVGEHGGFQESDKKMAFEKADKIIDYVKDLLWGSSAK